MSPWWQNWEMKDLRAGRGQAAGHGKKAGLQEQGIKPALREEQMGEDSHRPRSISVCGLSPRPSFPSAHMIACEATLPRYNLTFELGLV